MRDLDIRGAGNLLGAEQSGFISEIGFEMYHKILDEAMLELKETEFKEHFAGDDKSDHYFVNDCVLETDLQLLIPTDYVENTTERLSLYKELDNLSTEEQLERFAEQMLDRFGPVPSETQGLFLAIRLRWLAARSGFEKVILKAGKFIGYFVSNQDSEYYSTETFSKILNFVQFHPRKCQIREINDRLSLTVKQITEIQEAYEFLLKMGE